MNKTLYNTAMDKVTMSEECLGEIIDKLDYIQEKPTKKRKKVRYFQIITAVAIAIFGSITVAAETGGLDWVKNFFVEEEFLPSVYDMVSQIENFKYESDSGIKLYPLGTISDSKELCFLLSVENMPDGINFDHLNIYPVVSDDYDWSGGDIETSTVYNSDEKLLICKVYNSTNEAYEKDDFLQFELRETSYSEDKEDTNLGLGTLSFKLCDVGSANILNIDYSEYTPSDDYDNTFEKISITPLSIEAYSKKDFEFDTFRIVFNNGKEMNIDPTGGYSSYETKLYRVDKRFEENPINPDNITDIYYKDMLIYHKEETIVPDIYELVSEIKDFECESDFKVDFSPVGLISDEHDFYCILHIDSLPENLNPEFITIGGFESEHIKNDLTGLSYSMDIDYKAEENNLIFKVSSAQSIFKSGEKIEMTFDYFEQGEPSLEEKLHLANIAKASFTINSDYDKSLKIYYKDYMPDFIPERDYDFLIDEMTITPLSFTTNGRRSYYADVMLSDGFTLVFSDGTELKDFNGCTSSSYGTDELIRTEEEAESMNAIHYDTLAQFEEPIDPDSITEIYLGDMLIYRK